MTVAHEFVEISTKYNINRTQLFISRISARQFVFYNSNIIYTQICSKVNLMHYFTILWIIQLTWHNYFFLFSEVSSDDVDIETIDKDVKLLTYRPDVEPKSIESYRNSKLPRDPEVWEDNINKYVCKF